jgi:hypothetical protein
VAAGFSGSAGFGVAGCAAGWVPTSLSASATGAGCAFGFGCGPARRKPSPSPLNRFGAARNTTAAIATPATSHTHPGVPWLPLLRRAWFCRVVLPCVLRLLMLTFFPGR